MQLHRLLTVTLLALGVSAAPNIESRNGVPQCYGGQVYNDCHKQCECPPKQSWDKSKNKCSYPPMPPPQCPSPGKPYCSKSKDEWCPYDKGNDWCQDNGQNTGWCCDPSKSDKCKDNYPPAPPSCPGKQKWNAKEKCCKCPDPMVWKDSDQKCHWQPWPKPQCPIWQKPWCGKGKKSYCGYDDKNKFCENDGSTVTWCASDLDITSILVGLFDLD